MVIAVTGHSGFIGKHLCRAILDKGWTLIKISKEYEPVECDRIYHLACPSSTKDIVSNPISIMDIIIDGTRLAMKICPTAEFVNASSFGAGSTDGSSEQACYNTAKKLMELYLSYSEVECTNYRLPSIYGKGMSSDSFIQRCIDGNAYRPEYPDKMHYIMDIESLISSMIILAPLSVEEITLGSIYDKFS